MRTVRDREINICQECRAIMQYVNQYHPYEHCLMFKEGKPLPEPRPIAGTGPLRPFVRENGRLYYV